MTMRKTLAVLAIISTSVSAFALTPSVTSLKPLSKSFGVTSAAKPVSQVGVNNGALTVQGGGRGKAVAASSTAEADAPKEGALADTLLTGTYFALWYMFNIGYNIYNKQALNVLDFPWTIATIQMATGIAYFVPLWILGLRKAPKLSFNDLKTLFPIALCHTGVHVGAVIALGAGAVSFAHIVKASEPVVTCGLNALLLKEVLPLPVYLTLLPIIGGVAIASMKELSFPSSV